MLLIGFIRIMGEQDLASKLMGFNECILIVKIAKVYRLVSYSSAHLRTNPQLSFVAPFTTIAAVI